MVAASLHGHVRRRRHHQLSNPKTAKVNENSRLTVNGTALDLFFSGSDSHNIAYLVKLELAGASWTAQSGVSSTQSWSGTVNIKDYANRGAGIYKVSS
jgi:hypothetical protein